MSPEGNVYQKNVSREKLSVWAGLCGNGQVIGPLFYEGNLTGERYMEMLNNSIIPLMQQAYGHLFRYVWFMQDGAPAHRMIIIRNKLQELFGHRVIRLGFDVEWPPRSQDLTHATFSYGVISKIKSTKHLLHRWKSFVIELRKSFVY